MSAGYGKEKDIGKSLLQFKLVWQNKVCMVEQTAVYRYLLPRNIQLSLISHHRIKNYQIDQLCFYLKSDCKEKHALQNTPGFFNFRSLAIVPMLSRPSAVGTYPVSIISKQSRLDCWSPLYMSRMSDAPVLVPFNWW